ncbi:ABC transporter ATP-binding protein [Chondrocystis sp. NIES-4102]|nr:ABC transporter ATP-binding protein [Chondrocystis sp. NIES-4102]
MSILTLQNIKKDFGIKEVLRDASFSIDPNDKVGLIGVNGSGKSTLLKMIAGIEPIDGGQRLVTSGAKIIYLPQQPVIDENLTVIDQVFADSGEQMKLVREYEELSLKISHSTGASLEALMSRLATVSEKIEILGAWELETKAKIILTKLGIVDFDAKVGDLSGGYRKRIALATALLNEPDLLLMDEPTNHLDAESVEWLQDYLARFSGAILLITHDRYFLDQVTNRILEIDRADLYTYTGNYAYYLEKKAAQSASADSSFQKYQGILRRELEWLKKGPKARSTKQKARIGRIKDMQEQEFKQAQLEVDIDTPGRRIGKKVIELENISKAYNDRVLIQDFSYKFTPKDRIGIIGGNGAGKSTLMNIITGRITPDHGQVDIGQTIHIGYFDQHSDTLLSALNQEQRVIDYIKEVAEVVSTADGNKITASQMLEKFLFSPNQQYAPINQLSGGEKRRLFLLQVLMGAPNVLILDEPTNDLDVQTLTILEDYLDNFNGCVIVVSHDRYFLDRTVDFILAIESGGNVRSYPGNYSVYLDHQKQAVKTAKTESAPSKPRSSKPQNTNSNTQLKIKPLSNFERREYEKLEATIDQMEADKAKLEADLAINCSDFTLVQELSQKLASLNTKIETATERWLELAEREG